MLNFVVLVAYPLRERGYRVQDGPEVGLICRIRFLLGVTEADQGPIATIAEKMVKKADQGIKADRRQQHLRHKSSY